MGDPPQGKPIPPQDGSGTARYYPAVSEFFCHGCEEPFNMVGFGDVDGIPCPLCESPMTFVRRRTPTFVGLS